MQPWRKSRPARPPSSPRRKRAERRRRPSRPRSGSSGSDILVVVLLVAWKRISSSRGEGRAVVCGEGPTKKRTYEKTQALFVAHLCAVFGCCSPRCWCVVYPCGRVFFSCVINPGFLGISSSNNMLSHHELLEFSEHQNTVVTTAPPPVGRDVDFERSPYKRSAIASRPPATQQNALPSARRQARSFGCAENPQAWLGRDCGALALHFSPSCWSAPRAIHDLRILLERSIALVKSAYHATPVLPKSTRPYRLTPSQT